MRTEYVGVPAAAIKLGVEIKRVYELLYSGRLAGAEKQDGRWRIPTAAVEARLQRRETSHAPTGR